MRLSLLVISLLDHALFAWVIQNDEPQPHHSFLTLEDFLSSALWAQHKNTPRIISVEKENSCKLLSFETLSKIEIFCFWVQKKILNKDSSLIFLSWYQAIIFTHHLPPPLKKGPLLKVTSILLEILKKKPETKDGPCVCYYFHPFLGFWKFVMAKEKLLSYDFIPHLQEPLIENQLKIAQDQLYQKGIQEEVSFLM